MQTSKRSVKWPSSRKWPVCVVAHSVVMATSKNMTVLIGTSTHLSIDHSIVGIHLSLSGAHGFFPSIIILLWINKSVLGLSD